MLQVLSDHRRSALQQQIRPHFTYPSNRSKHAPSEYLFIMEGNDDRRDIAKFVRTVPHYLPENPGGTPWIVSRLFPHHPENPLNEDTHRSRICSCPFPGNQPYRLDCPPAYDVFHVVGERNQHSEYAPVAL